ncbi:ATPase, AAA family protein [Cardiosporidium cionae]|uniref:ATPase, AAA family protein n=1 Tax=Cardiosporidium cionae TaxID=476202 RepID=A0ABQ7JBF1_9APIC|nr:ATPase, AAA family protein [Cardiosporidium cionae]|eukprot:KAF8821319.1 ATPase, AAA family protein [Cardiosporidium cionae]
MGLLQKGLDSEIISTAFVSCLAAPINRTEVEEQAENIIRQFCLQCMVRKHREYWILKKMTYLGMRPSNHIFSIAKWKQENRHYRFYSHMLKDKIMKNSQTITAPKIQLTEIDQRQEEEETSCIHSLIQKLLYTEKVQQPLASSVSPNSKLRPLYEYSKVSSTSIAHSRKQQQNKETIKTKQKSYCLARLKNLVEEMKPAKTEVSEEHQKQREEKKDDVAGKKAQLRLYKQLMKALRHLHGRRMIKKLQNVSQNKRNVSSFAVKKQKNSQKKPLSKPKCYSLPTITSSSNLDSLHKEMQDKGILKRSCDYTLDDFVEEEHLVVPKGDIGYPNIKRTVLEKIIFPLLSKNVRVKLHSIVRSVLLYGPQGNGKQLLALIAAAETGATFLDLTEELKRGYDNTSAIPTIIHKVFCFARQKAPTIIFIKNIDSLLWKRQKVESEEGNTPSENVQIKKELLQHVKAFINRGGPRSRDQDRIVLLATMSQPINSSSKRESLSALFDTIIYVRLPSYESRMCLWMNTLPKQLRASPSYHLYLSILTKVTCKKINAIARFRAVSLQVP